MVAPLTFAGGITVEAGVNAGAHNAYEGLMTVTYQNVGGTADPTGFFFINGGAGWADLGSVPNLNQVAAGWQINGDPNWVVVSTNPAAQTITSNGNSNFTPGSFYFFVGV